MIKNIYLIITIFLVSALEIHSANLDVGDDVNFEYRYIKRASDVYSSNFRQKIRFYLEGQLQNDIDIGVSMQSSGIMNSTDTYVVFEGAKIRNLEPFFDRAYIRINNYYGYPLSLTIGKIPLVWMNGLLVNDNDLGLPAILMNIDAPFDLDIEAFHSRSRNELLDISDIRGYGARVLRDFGFRNLELDWTLEKYTSSAYVWRRIYGASFTRNMQNGLEYNFFAYKMKGKKGQIGFDGHAIGAFGKFEGIINPIGKGGAWIKYALGSGNDSDDERGFLPILSKIDAEDIGDYYGRFREFRIIDNLQSSLIDLSYSYANLSLFKQSVYATVRDDLDVFIIRSTYKKHSPELPIGGSFTMGANYRYAFLSFQFRYTTFTPESAYDQPSENPENPNKIYTLTISGRF